MKGERREWEQTRDSGRRGEVETVRGERVKGDRREWGESRMRKKGERE